MENYNELDNIEGRLRDLDDRIEFEDELMLNMMNDISNITKSIIELTELKDIVVEDRARVNNAQMVTNAFNILEKLFILDQIDDEDYCNNLKFLLELQDLKLVDGLLKEIEK